MKPAARILAKFRGRAELGEKSTKREVRELAACTCPRHREGGAVGVGGEKKMFEKEE